MSARPAEELLEDLGRDLAAAPPIPRLRVSFAGVVFLGLLIIAFHWMFGAPRPRFENTALWSAPAFLLALGGLVLVAAGALVAALADSVPGREAAARSGLGVLLVGLAFTLGGAWWAVATGENPPTARVLDTSLECIARAGALGILPSLLLCAIVSRAWPRRRYFAAMLAGTGTIALGAVAVHASCPYGGALHMLLGHALAPVVAAVLLVLPLGLLVRAFAGSRGLSIPD